MNKEALSKLSDEATLLLKEEAEKNLSNIHHIEDIITAKSSNLLNICLTFFVIVSGYMFKSFSDNEFGILFVLSILSMALLAYIVYYLHSSIMPNNTKISGAEPKKLLTDDFVKGDKDDLFRILSNRVYCLQDAIDASSISYRKRRDDLNFSSKVLFIGLFSIVSIGLILFTFQLCQCPY